MSLYKRGKSWYANVTIHGRRIHRKFGDTRQEALRNMEDLKTSVRRGELQIKDYNSEPVFLQTAAKLYLDHVKKTYSTRTFGIENNNWTVHIQPVLGLKTITEINNEALLKFQANRRTAGKANRTINMAIQTIRKIINHAIDCKLCRKPDIKYPMLREPKKQHAFLTPQEYSRLIAVNETSRTAPDPRSRMAFLRVIFGKNTGLRPAELAYLTWNDVDFDMKTIKIKSKKEWRIKTDQERTVPLNAIALDILKALWQKTRHRWVFSTTDRPVLSIRKALQNMADRAGIKRITPNMLRHTFVTHALMAGAGLQDVATIAGHTSLETTNRYAHAIQSGMRNTVDLVAKTELSPQNRHIHKKTRRP